MRPYFLGVVALGVPLGVHEEYSPAVSFWLYHGDFVVHFFQLRSDHFYSGWLGYIGDEILPTYIES